MARLFFRFGAMNSAKSANLLAVNFNYHERGMRTFICKPSIDTKSPLVMSRMGVSAPIDLSVDHSTNLLDEILASHHRDLIACVLVDESQFLSPRQIEELFEVTVRWNIPVIAYGLRTDFQTKLFPGSKRLMELSHRIEELKTVCRCGDKAIFNGRIVNGEFASEGDSVAIDGTVDYESVCGFCYLDRVGDIHQDNYDTQLIKD